MLGKKVIISALMFCLLLIMIPANAAFASDQSFSPAIFNDVKGSDWYYTGVKAAYESGLMEGMGGGKFLPNNDLTLAQANIHNHLKDSR